MVADLETFAKVRALHERTDSPGEKTAAMLKMQTLARKAGMSVEQAMSTLDRESKAAPQPEFRSQAQTAADMFNELFNTPEMRAQRAEREAKRQARCRELLAEYGSEDAVWADTEREAALRRACEPLLGPGQTWKTIYHLDGWGSFGSRSQMPQSVRRTVSEAWPLPTNVSGAWAEYEAAEKLDNDRCAFCPDYTPHTWAEARRYILEDLCHTLPARSLRDIRGRLSWMEHVARLDIARSWEEQEPTLQALRADIERMGARLRDEDAETVQNGQSSIRSGASFTTKSQNSGSGRGDVQDGQCGTAQPLSSPDPGIAMCPVYSGRRTNADKRRDVLALLGQDLTDREIARRAGVSPQTVGNIRRRV